MLVLADRGFPSRELCRKVAGTGAQLAFRASASFTLPVTARLADGTYLTELRGRRKGERMTVRVIEFSVKDPAAGISGVFALITTVIDHERYDAESIARLYLRRWRAETLIHPEDLPRMLIRVYRGERSTPRAAHRTTGRHPERRTGTGLTRTTERELIVRYLTR
jgi:hypothetical protein